MTKNNAVLHHVLNKSITLKIKVYNIERKTYTMLSHSLESSIQIHRLLYQHFSKTCIEPPEALSLKIFNSPQLYLSKWFRSNLYFRFPQNLHKTRCKHAVNNGVYLYVLNMYNKHKSIFETSKSLSFFHKNTKLSLCIPKSDNWHKKLRKIKHSNAFNVNICSWCTFFFLYQNM